jgi:hypothetical protein
VDVRIGASQSGTLHYRGRVPDSGAAADAGGAPRGGVLDLDLPPGTVALRLAAEDARGTVLDTIERELDVPDFTAPQLRMATPAVYLARTPREARAIVAGERAVPTALREFRRTDRVVVRLAARAPGGVAPAFSARLLNRAGGAMRDLPLAAPAEEQAGAGAALEVPLATLPVGEYLVEVRAAVEGAEPILDLLAFRMVP